MYKIDNIESFEKDYETYKKAVKHGSGGLIETNKIEYIKIAAYFNSLIAPQIDECFKVILESINKK